jgi:hypothetical protein
MAARGSARSRRVSRRAAVASGSASRGAESDSERRTKARVGSRNARSRGAKCRVGPTHTRGRPRQKTRMCDLCGAVHSMGRQELERDRLSRHRMASPPDDPMPPSPRLSSRRNRPATTAPARKDPRTKLRSGDRAMSRIRLSTEEVSVPSVARVGAKRQQPGVGDLGPRCAVAATARELPTSRRGQAATIAGRAARLPYFSVSKPICRRAPTSTPFASASKRYARRKSPVP